MTRLGWTIFTLVCGVVLAAAVHIVAILLAPAFAEDGPLARAMRDAPLHQVTLLPAASPAYPGLPFSDPATAIAVCPFDLGGDPTRVKINAGDELMTVSFHAIDGRVFYALSDRAAQRGVIDLLLMTRAQLDEALSFEEEEGDAPRGAPLLSPVMRGYVVARALALAPSDMANARLLASGLTCAPDASVLGR